ncbi:MAG TPA: M23 family metallopeptidase [Pyrinomonadaceae bacterium]|jgi:murein DD-endopeptidase MepM/ murein hydrolase activator NlpD
MKRTSIFFFVFGLIYLSNATGSNYIFGQKPSAVPVDLEIPFAPAPVKVEGKIQLLYELHLTNFRPKSLELTRVEIFKDEADAPPIAVYKDAELASRLKRPGAAADLPNKRIIGGGMRAIIFLQVIFNTTSEIPPALCHRLFFKAETPKDGETSVEGARIAVRQNPPLIVGSPLKGEGWLALNGFSNNSDHRRAIIAVNGKARIAQRFATDWTRIGADGQAFRGNPANNANWVAYGAEVLAVGDGVIVDVKDGIPENDPTTDKKAVPITLETVGGNYIILDLGNGFFAFYAHLQPKSQRVKIGDKVTHGQALALLGNSGNSDAPHLHFHVADANSPLGAEGVPFVFESFEMQGILPSEELLTNGKGWKPPLDAPKDKRLAELPVANAIVRFP